VSADPVQAFLQRRTFFCIKLCANLTPEECAARQKRETTIKAYGRKITLNNNPPDKYCRSGECKQGKEQVVKLRVKRRKLKEKRAAERLTLREARSP
jgi:hypothetical protein